VRTEINDHPGGFLRLHPVSQRYRQDQEFSVHGQAHCELPFGVKSFQMAAQVRVGVGVFVFNAAGAFIMGKRKGSHGAGTSFKAIHVHFYYYTNFLHTV
jgi:hypothetical protein